MATTGLGDASAEGVQVYGQHYSAPRVKWTCGRCGKRNDTALAFPIQAHESGACRHCHRVSVFTRKETR